MPGIISASQCRGDLWVDAGRTREVHGGIAANNLDFFARPEGLDHLPAPDVDRDVRDVRGIGRVGAVEEQVAGTLRSDSPSCLPSVVETTAAPFATLCQSGSEAATVFAV